MQQCTHIPGWLNKGSGLFDFFLVLYVRGQTIRPPVGPPHLGCCLVLCAAAALELWFLFNVTAAVRQICMIEFASQQF